MSNKKIVVTSFKTVDTLTSSGMISAVKETLYRDLIILRDKGFYCAVIMYGLRDGELWTVFLQNEVATDEGLMEVAHDFIKSINGE